MAELAGRPMVSRVVSTVGSAGLEPVVVAKPDSPLPPLDCRVLSEPSEPRHPLTGIVTALRASAGRGVVAIACDMPLVPSRLLRSLAERDAPTVVCERDGRLEPLLGRYSPASLAALDEALERGAAVRDAVAALDPEVVGEEEIARFGDPELILFNVNSPDDLRIAERLLGRGGRIARALRAGIRRGGPSGR